MKVQDDTIQSRDIDIVTFNLNGICPTFGKEFLLP